MRVDEYNSFESLLARYRQALTQLESHGIQIAGGSRLRIYERRLQQVVSDPRPALEEELVFAVAFDLREIDELIEIVNHLPVPLDPPAFDLLKKVCGGNDNPDDELAATAREAQYELYLGAVLRRAGIAAKHGAPDLAAPYQDEIFFIEAKRPSSTSRVDDRVRSAIHQIRRLSSPGIIAMSLDQVLRPTRGILAVRGFDDLAPAVDQLIRNFIFENVNLWRKRLTKEPLAALLLTARIPGRLTSTGHSVLGTGLHVEILSSPSERHGAAAFIEQAVVAYQTAQQ